MREALIYIMENYLQEKRLPLKNNALADYIRGSAATQVEAVINTGHKNYQVTGSPGLGNWALIPWIAVFDPDITTTATKG